MPRIALAGPSAPDTSRSLGLSRTVNMYPKQLEGSGERATWGLKDIRGLVEAPWGLSGEMRGGYSINGRAFVVVGADVYELFADGTKDLIASAIGGSGRVGMASNTTQLAIGDGTLLTVYSFASHSSTAVAYPGKARIHFVDQRIVFIHRDTQRFGWTELGNAADIDALSFSSAEGSPDNLVDHEIDRREWILGGSDSGEIWSSTGTDEVFARNGGAFFEVGVAAEFVMHKMGGTTIWASPRGRVFRLDGYREVAVSTDWVEQKLSTLDMGTASAFAVECDGHAFYCLNVEGLDTTLVFDLKTGQWHEWAELVDGAYTPHRAIWCMYAFGGVYLAGDDGKLYEFTSSAHTNDGDPLPRDRVFPNSNTADGRMLRFGTATVDCDRGYGGVMQMRYSNDNTPPTGNWRYASLGEIGERLSPVQFHRCGAGRDRVWQIRCTADAPFNPVSVSV